MSDARRKAETKTRNLIESVKGVADGTGLNKAAKQQGGWGMVLVFVVCMAALLTAQIMRCNSRKRMDEKIQRIYQNHWWSNN